MSNYLEDGMVAVLNGTALPSPANFYVALYTTATGEDFDFTDAVTVRFVMYTDSVDRVEKVDSTAVVVTPATSGRLKYVFTESDTDTAGDYLAEFTTTFIDASKSTAPHDGYIRVRVLPDLDDE